MSYQRVGVTWSSRVRSRGAREGRNVSDLEPASTFQTVVGMAGSKSSALFCFSCKKLMRVGGVPHSDGLCGACFTRLTVKETAKALLVLASVPAMWIAGALF